MHGFFKGLNSWQKLFTFVINIFGIVLKQHSLESIFHDRHVLKLSTTINFIMKNSPKIVKSEIQIIHHIPDNLILWLDFVVTRLYPT